LYDELMESPQSKLAEFTGEEFIQIGEIARPFWERGTSENPPKFAIVIGGIASGKPTMRRQKYAEGYVHFDYGEIHSEIGKAVGRDNERLGMYAALACDLILRESLAPRKNIVIEIIGEDYAPIGPVIGVMRQLVH
jgi:hypothetical protein